MYQALKIISGINKSFIFYKLKSFTNKSSELVFNHIKLDVKIKEH